MVRASLGEHATHAANVPAAATIGCAPCHSWQLVVGVAPLVAMKHYLEEGAGHAQYFNLHIECHAANFL